MGEMREGSYQGRFRFSSCLLEIRKEDVAFCGLLWGMGFFSSSLWGGYCGEGKLTKLFCERDRVTSLKSPPENRHTINGGSKFASWALRVHKVTETLGRFSVVLTASLGCDPRFVCYGGATRRQVHRFLHTRTSSHRSIDLPTVGDVLVLSCRTFTGESLCFCGAIIPFRSQAHRQWDSNSGASAGLACFSGLTLRRAHV